MRRQISRAILGVAILLVLGLGLPLALVVQQFYEDRATADLERRAAETITEIALPLDRAELDRVTDEPDSPGVFTVYDRAGRRIAGPGPALADDAVDAALRGTVGLDVARRPLIVAAPLTERTSETVVGAVRVTESTDVVDGDVRRAWLAMAIAVAVALAAAALLARAQAARRLAEPVTQLAEHAAELGSGFAVPATRSGIEEVDIVADALAASGERLASLLARERAFSADVAHQLRTPLTALRLTLERLAAEDGASTEIPALLAEVGRLTSTVEHLLSLARDRQPATTALDLDDLLDGVTARWAGPLRGLGRELRIERAETDGTVLGSTLSIGEVLDVLVDNARRHGDGTVTVRARPAAGGVVVEVTDEGAGITGNVDVFRRHTGDSHGIGLALARSITEAEGGRLLLATTRPPCFQVVLPAAGTDA